jgi:D-alanine transaminase
MPRPPLKYAFLDGAFIEASEARVSAFDRGFLFGDGAYEVIPFYGASPFHADRHLARLADSLAGIQLETPWDDAWWMEHIGVLIARNGGGDQSLYLQVTRGAEHGRDHRFPGPGTKPTVFMFSTAIPERDPAVDETGLSAAIAEDFRWDRCHLKTISLLANVLLRHEAHARGADEVILHRGGRLTEASISNVYLVRDGKVFTPQLGQDLLPGVTRAVLLDLCRKAGVEVVETDLSTTDLRNADEIWISSSTRELAAIVQVDGAPVADGKPGPMFRRLRAAMDEEISAWRHDETDRRA